LAASMSFVLQAQHRLHRMGTISDPADVVAVVEKRQRCVAADKEEVSS